jgi:hypothetical protein
MYVRWQTYRSQALNPRHRARNDKHARLKAVLVESVRVGGKPRQMHIAFLGSMSIDRSDMHRFWREVTARLDQLGNRVGPEDRDRLLASIAERVEEVSRRRSSWSNTPASVTRLVLAPVAAGVPEGSLLEAPASPQGGVYLWLDKPADGGHSARRGLFRHDPEDGQGDRRLSGWRLGEIRRALPLARVPCGPGC